MSPAQKALVKIRPWMRFSAARHPRAIALLGSNDGEPPRGALADLVEDGLRYQELLQRAVLVLGGVESGAIAAPVGNAESRRSTAHGQLFGSAVEMEAFLARPVDE